ncbi:MAG: pyocin activator PrtN family protein [Marinoscillum sp.]
MIRYQSPTIPLEAICEEYFGCTKGTAKLRAKSGNLPIPAFRLGKSQKLPWMINLEDLATHIDKTHEEAKKEWIGPINC